MKGDPYLPTAAKIVDRTQETKNIFTLSLNFIEQAQHENFKFNPGQFNMLYLYGIGEVAISIVSDPENTRILSHTIRAIGRVTKALQLLKIGDYLGVRGPFGRGWPLQNALNKDIIIITGGLGCAPTVSIINYIMAQRKQYGKLSILQGVKHSDDFIFHKQYEKWQKSPNTEVHVAADQAQPKWPWSVGYVTDMINLLNINTSSTVVMMCGPEMMMNAAIKALQGKVSEDNIYLSMERNMECAIGHCGHCQYGGSFICKNGPVFAYPEVKALFNIPGF